MKSLVPIALWVDDNEPCISLSEQNMTTSRSGVGLRRMQTIKVIRNDKPHEYRSDLGPAASFGTEEFAFVGAVPLSNGHWDVLENVGRLRGFANEYRAQYTTPTPRNSGHDDLKKDFEVFATKRRDARNGRSHFAM
jgi:hypothetical protein